MNDKTQPEALRIADEFKLCSEFDSIPSIIDIEKAEAELRRQHTRIAELEAEVAAVGAGGVQALSAAPAGWKLVPVEPTNDMQKAADEWAAKGFDWPKAVYRAMLAASPTPPAEQQAAPKAAPVVWLSSKQLRGVTALHGQYLPFRCQPVGRFDTPVYLVEAAPKTAPQQEAPKAAQYEMDKEASNVRLDIDSNSTEPEQQRDVACSLEVGQHVGNGEHQEASCRGSKDSELMKIAARNLKYFIEHAQFSSFADKRAALNCLDALAAPQQDAPKAAPGEQLTREQIREVFMAHGFTIKEGQTDLKQYVYDAAHALLELVAAPQQEAQEPYAYAVYFPDQPKVELVHDLDELIDDLTNRQHTVTKLYTAAQPAPDCHHRPPCNECAALAAQGGTP